MAPTIPLVIACSLAQPFTPPPGWTVTVVTPVVCGDGLLDQEYTIPPATQIRLERQIHPGDVVPVPAGCLRPKVIAP